jgi:hypothetical protein
MKKVAVLALCLLALAATIRGMGMGPVTPATLEISVRLIDDGPNVTTQFQKYVGFVPEGRSGTPTLGNIQIIRPNAENENVFEVPPNKDIGVFILSSGVPPFQSIVNVSAGQHRRHDVVLNAGIVQVTTERSPGTRDPNIWFLGPDGQFDANDQYADGAQFVVPAGPQVFQVGRHLQAKRERIDVIAGQTHNLNIVNELGNLTVNLETSVPFEALSPTPIMRAEGGSNFLHQRGSIFDGGRWQLGTYEVEIELFKRFSIPTRPASTDSFTVVIDQSENTMTIPMPLVGIEALFTDWPDGVPEYAMALIVSVSDPGLPFATYRVTDDRAPLIFLPPDDAHDFAIALVSDNRVLALHAVGSLSPESPVREIVPLGGDASVCVEIILDFDCDQLSR